MDKTDDAKLVKDFLKGNEKSLDFLVLKYLKPIYTFVYRNIGRKDEAEDITQDVFIKVWKNIRKFDRKKSFKTWIFTIAKNTATDWQRKKKSIPLSSFENEDGKNVIIEKLVDLSPLPNEIFYQKNLQQKLESLIKKLSPGFRTILLLRYNDHFKFREIAEVLEEPLQTVKSRHRRAILALKKLLLAHEPKDSLDSY
jgi:RNA polymerase sigma-70 factor (ECF subfamily)